MILATLLASSIYTLSASIQAAAYAMLVLNDTSTAVPAFFLSNSTSPADPMSDKRSRGGHQWKLGMILFWLLLVGIGLYLLIPMVRIVLDKHGIHACDWIRRQWAAGSRRLPQSGNANGTPRSIVELIFPPQCVRRLRNADPSVLPSHQTPQRTPIPNHPSAMAIPLEARQPPPGRSLSNNLPRSSSPTSLAGSEWSDSSTIAPEPDPQPRRPFLRESTYMPA
ncbi:hypothetical protein FB45DRAFT_931775 [Roridomyces roridus]|uniref:Uncharacterized protein n=1 Tax=Roridomyces roridus TaxID=1738132 RepID=A0AAD7BEL7_9AGAR|nr:hypothetical protein FB45DRAFT_931775 [Roridomyces roridus]